jgi:hypothetical protein
VVLPAAVRPEVEDVVTVVNPPCVPSLPVQLDVGVYSDEEKSDPEPKPIPFLQLVVVDVNHLNEVVAPQEPFSWWKPWTWYRNGTRVWSKFQRVKLAENSHRVIHEENTKCLRDDGDIHQVVVSGYDSHWEWMPARAKPEYKAVVSRTMFTQMCGRYSVDDIPEPERVDNYVVHVASVNWPRDIVDVAGNVSKLNCVNCGKSTVTLFRDVKYSVAAESRLVFPFGPGWQGLPNLFSSVIANPTCAYLLFQLRGLLTYIGSMTVWRAVVQSILVSIVTWLALLYLPLTLGISLQRSLGSYTGLPGLHLTI